MAGVPNNLGVFHDRRDWDHVTAVGKGFNPAESYRAGLKRPDKPGQSSRAHIDRLQRTHLAVATGSAAVTMPMRPQNQFAPVPSVVDEHVANSWRNSLASNPGNVLPQRQSRGSRVRGALRRLDQKAGF